MMTASAVFAASLTAVKSIGCGPEQDVSRHPGSTLGGKVPGSFPSAVAIDGTHGESPAELLGSE